MMKKHIAFVCPYPRGGAPSQRFRFEQYLDLLTERGYSYSLYGFLDTRTHQVLYHKNRLISKVLGVILGYLRRAGLLVKLQYADFVFIHREATPFGPPWLEWVVAQLFKKKIIYDFDDAIWLEDTSNVNPLISKLKWQRKVANVCRWSYRISAGNDYLASYALQYNQGVTVNPTTLDTATSHTGLKDQASLPLTIGWTGSHSTMKYLYLLEKVLQELEATHDFRTVVISNQAPELDLNRLEYIPWQKATEVSDLRQIHIGLMPLPDDAWARGKCGFKALQYLSLGIPALVSPVGVNARIVTHGTNGYHCITDEDWYQYLSQLLKDASLRSKLGQNGRQTVVNQYSVEANTDNFLSLFD